MPGILWLASYPKSGNTWMRAFLANLILDAPEPLPLKRISEVCPSEPAEIWFRPLVQGPVADLSPKEIAALRVKTQERVVGLNKNVVPMKTHSYLGEDCGHPIFSMTATFGAVYIIRDPRDVASPLLDQAAPSWTLTTGSINVLTSAGVSATGPNRLKAGDVIQVSFNPSRNGSNLGFLRSMTLPDGKTEAEFAPN